MRWAWHAFFQNWDVLLTPVAAGAAWPHDQKGERLDRVITVNGKPENTNDQLFWAGISGVVHLPSTVTPDRADGGGAAAGRPDHRRQSPGPDLDRLRPSPGARDRRLRPTPGVLSAFFRHPGEREEGASAQRSGRIEEIWEPRPILFRLRDPAIQPLAAAAEVGRGAEFPRPLRDRDGLDHIVEADGLEIGDRILDRPALPLPADAGEDDDGAVAGALAGEIAVHIGDILAAAQDIELGLDHPPALVAAFGTEHRSGHIGAVAALLIAAGGQLNGDALAAQLAVLIGDIALAVQHIEGRFPGPAVPVQAGGVEDRARHIDAVAAQLIAAEGRLVGRGERHAAQLAVVVGDIAVAIDGQHAHDIAPVIGPAIRHQIGPAAPDKALHPDILAAEQIAAEGWVGGSRGGREGQAQQQEHRPEDEAKTSNG